MINIARGQITISILEKGDTGKDGHSLYAKAFIEGTYHNGFTKGVKSYVKVYYDGNEVTDFNVTYRYKGAGQKDWYQIPNKKEDSWGDTQRDGSTLFVEYVVEYKGLKVIATEKLDNIKDGISGVDAEFDSIEFGTCYGVVDKDDNLLIKVLLNIKHYKGDKIVNKDFSSYLVETYPSYDYSVDYDWTKAVNADGSFEFKKAIPNYSKITNKPTMIWVDVKNESGLLQKKIVPITLQPTVYQKINQQLGTYELRLQSSETKIIDANNKITDANNKINDANNKITDTNNKITNANNKISNVEKSVKLNTASINANSKQIALKAEQSTVNTLNDKLKSTEKSIGEIKVKNNEISSEVKETKTILDGNLIYNSNTKLWTNAYGFCYNNVIPLVKGKTYTLTIRGKIDLVAKNNNKTLKVHIFDKDWNYFSRDVSIDSTELTTKSVTFTYPIDVDVEILVAGYMHPSGGNRDGKVYLEWMMLREGSEQKEYTDRMFGVTTTTSSLIKQTKDEILLKTDKAGLKLNGDGIELDADKTTIKGNLNITDTKNGITVYETIKNKVLVPRINLLPKEIADITNIGNDTYDLFNASVNQLNNNNWSLNFGNHYIDCKKNDIIVIDNVYLSEERSKSNGYKSTPYVNTAKLVIKLLKDNKDIETKELTLTKKVGGHFISNNEVKFSISENGKYKLIFSSVVALRADSDYPIMKANLSARILKAENVMTYIGNDGMYSHSGPNKCFYVNNKQTLLQHGFNGIKWDNSATTFGNNAMKVVAKVDGTYPNYKAVWYPFYNYTPTFQPKEFIKDLNYNISNNTFYYIYKINPLTDCGICLVMNPAINENGNKLDSWILLPSSTFEGDDGKLYQLPVGYTLEVVYGGFDNNQFILNVTAKTKSKSQATFIDKEGIKQNSIQLDRNVHLRLFIYIGNYYSKDINGNQDIWIVK